MTLQTPSATGLLAAAILFLCPPPAAAQGPAGSESATTISRGVPVAAGVNLDWGLGISRVEIQVGLPGSLERMESASFRLDPGIVWSEPNVPTAQPIVFGAVPGSGAAAGGDSVKVLGMNFIFQGQPASSVTFGGAASPSVTGVGTTSLTAQTPPGTDAAGNPLGLAEVQVGQSHPADVFVYRPAIAQPSPAQAGKPLELDLYFEPGSITFLVAGVSLPGVTVPIAPLDGALAIISDIVFLVNGGTAPTGFSKVVLPLPG